MDNSVTEIITAFLIIAILIAILFVAGAFVVQYLAWNILSVELDFITAGLCAVGIRVLNRFDLTGVKV